MEYKIIVKNKVKKDNNTSVSTTKNALLVVNFPTATQETVYRNHELSYVHS